MFEFLENISKFFTDGIYNFFVELWAWFVVKFSVAWIEFQIAAMKFAWDIAKQIVVDLGLAEKVNAAWSGLPAQIYSTAAFFRLPDAFNMILNAGITRFVLRFIPGAGS